MLEHKQKISAVSMNDFPSVYFERLLSLLTPEEWKVLSYIVFMAAREQENRITVREFSIGTFMSEATIKKCLENLVNFGVVVRKKENDPMVNAGVFWVLRVDVPQFDIPGMRTRLRKKIDANISRTKAAREKKGL